MTTIILKWMVEYGFTAFNQMSLKLDHFHSFFPLSSFSLPFPTFLYNHNCKFEGHKINHGFNYL